MGTRALVLASTILVLVAASPAAASPHVVGDTIVLDAPPEFPTDGTTLLPASEAILAGLASFLVAHPEIERVRVQYFVDQRGTQARSEELAYGRMGVVLRFLELHGIADERLVQDIQRGCVDGPDGHCMRRHFELHVVHLSAAERLELARLAERRTLFATLSDAGARCGGMRDFSVEGRLGLAFAAACFFAPGTTELRHDAAPLVQRLAHALAAVPTRTYTVGSRAAESAAHPWRTTSTQAAAIVEALIAAGVSADRLSAVGYGDRVDEEVYDGPSTLAPGGPLVEISLVPLRGELPSP